MLNDVKTECFFRTYSPIGMSANRCSSTIYGCFCIKKRYVTTKYYLQNISIHGVDLQAAVWFPTSSKFVNKIIGSDWFFGRLLFIEWGRTLIGFQYAT